jgi:hypothetical protein
MIEGVLDITGRSLVIKTKILPWGLTPNCLQHCKSDETAFLLERSSRKFLTHLAVESDMSLGSVHSTVQLL